MTPEQIADAQRRLRLRVTGVIDDEFREAVRRYQMTQRLLVTGDLDEATYQRLWENELLGPRVGHGGHDLTRDESDTSTLPD